MGIWNWTCEEIEKRLSREWNLGRDYAESNFFRYRLLKAASSYSDRRAIRRLLAEWDADLDKAEGRV